MKPFAGPLAVLACAAVVGCGGAPEGPKTYPVKGKVVFKGDNRPLRGGQVSFLSTTDPNRNGQGEINDQGEFTIFHFAGNKKQQGLTEGTYKVTVIPPQGRDQSTRPIALSKDVKVTATGPNDFTLELSGTAKKPG